MVNSIDSVIREILTDWKKTLTTLLNRIIEKTPSKIKIEHYSLGLIETFVDRFN